MADPKRPAEKTPAEKARETRAQNQANQGIVDAANAQIARQDAAGTHLVSEGPVSDELGKGGNPPPLPPAVSGEVPGTEDDPTENAPPPPNPPAVGDDRPDEPQAVPMPEPLEDVDDQTARQDRGRPAPQVPDEPSRSQKPQNRRAELLRKMVLGTIEDDEVDELVRHALKLGNPSPLIQATPTTDLPTAPPRLPDGSVPALPGQTEGTTSGQSPENVESVTFNSGDHPELKQVLASGETVEFHGGLFTTSNAEHIRMLRDRINPHSDNFVPGGLYYEDDPVAIMRCPFCKYTTPNESKLKAHIAKAHG